MGVEFKVSRTIIREDLEGVDILFVNRSIGKPVGITAKEVLRNMKDEFGVSVIVDYDDHWDLGDDHILYNHYKENDLVKIMIEHLEIADAVTVTHERLEKEARKYNNNVHVLPNAIPRYGQFLFPKQHDDKTRLFWAGSVTHDNDLKLLRRPLQLIKRDNVKFIMGGFQHNHPVWKEMAKHFTGNSSFNTEVLEFMPVDKYYALYSKCDISLIPLVENKFNIHKSNLKILEAANISAPVIVNRVHPYLDFPEELVNYVDMYNTWYKQINKLLRCPEEAQYQGEKLKEYCQKVYNFNEINERRKQLFYETRKQKITGDIPALSNESGMLRDES